MRIVWVDVSSRTDSPLAAQAAETIANHGFYKKLRSETLHGSSSLLDNRKLPNDRGVQLRCADPSTATPGWAAATWRDRR